MEPSSKRIIQIVLLLVIAGVVTGLVLTFDPRGGRRSDVVEKNADDPLLKPFTEAEKDGQPVELAGEGFEVRKSRGDILDFLLKAKKALAFEKGKKLLEDSELVLFADEVENIRVLGGKASYDPETDTVSLPEGFKLEYKGQFTVEGGALTFDRGTGKLTSEGPVKVTDGDLAGQAAGMTVNREEETARLTSVVLSGTLNGGAAQLTAPALVLDMKRRSGALEGPVDFTSGTGDRVHASRAELTFDEARRLRAVALVGNVSGAWRGTTLTGSRIALALAHGGAVTQVTGANVAWNGPKGAGRGGSLDATPENGGWNVRLTGGARLELSEGRVVDGASATLKVRNGDAPEGSVQGTPVRVTGLTMGDKGVADMTARTVAWDAARVTGEGDVHVDKRGEDAWTLRAQSVAAQRDGASGTARGAVRLTRGADDVQAQELTWDSNGEGGTAHGAVHIVNVRPDGARLDARARNARWSEASVALEGDVHATGAGSGGGDPWSLAAGAADIARQAGKVREVTAHGAVTFARGALEGNGARIAWRPDARAGELYGEPAELRDHEGGRQLQSHALAFTMDGKHISVRGLDGQTVTARPLKAPAAPAEPASPEGVS